MNSIRALRALLRSIRGGPGHTGPPSDHFDGHHFFNPDAPTGRSFGDFLRWQHTAKRKPWPSWVENRAHPAVPAQLSGSQIALTFINHITFLIQFRGLNILTDPVYSDRVSPLRNRGPKRVRAPGLRPTLVQPGPGQPQLHAVGRIRGSGRRKSGVARISTWRRGSPSEPTSVAFSSPTRASKIRLSSSRRHCSVTTSPRSCFKCWRQGKHGFSSGNLFALNVWGPEQCIGVRSSAQSVRTASTDFTPRWSVVGEPISS